MLAAIDVWDSIRRTRLAGEPSLQTAATRRAVFPGVGAAAMLPASMRQLRVRVAQIAMRGLSFVPGPRSRDLVWGLTTVGSPPRRPRTWLLLPDVITYRCDRAVGLTVDNQNRRHPHSDSVCCLRDFSRTRPRCMLPHATVTDPLVPVLPAVERQCMASQVDTARMFGAIPGGVVWGLSCLRWRVTGKNDRNSSTGPRISFRDLDEIGSKPIACPRV
jgi:hypothetical protein